MQSRFLPAFLVIFFFFGFFNLFGQNQDSIIIDGIVGPTCGCDGFVDVSVSSNSPSQPPGFFFYAWSNGVTTQDLFSLCPGTYCVTVTNGNAQGSTAVKCFTVQNVPFDPIQIISSNPAPCNTDSSGVSSDCEKACPGATITYTVSIPTIGGGTNPPIFSWLVNGATSWVVTNNSTPNAASSSITITWGGPGIGSVTVFTDGASGCNGEDALCVTIIDEPKADFTSNPAAAIAGGNLQVCLGQTVHFTNKSTGDADYFEWLFSDDLSTTSEENPSHTYLLPGVHTVRLVASSGCLCSDTTTMTVEVFNAQAPTLECVATVCAGATVTYLAANACPPFSWAVGPEGTILNGGTPLSDSVTIQWNAGPSGSITLGAQPCSGAACPVAGIIEVPVISGNAQITGEERVCPGAREVYTIEPYGGASFTWTLPSGGAIIDGQGTNRVTVEWNIFPNPAPAADHSLYVQYDNCYLGCGGADLIHVRILSAFRIDGPVEACESTNESYTSKLNFNNANIICNWTLYAPDGTVAWTSPITTATPNVPFVNGPGRYRLFAYPADPNSTCSELADWVINVPPTPIEPMGIVGATDICPGSVYTYEATGLPPGANIRWIIKNGPAAPNNQSGNPLNVLWGPSGPYWLTAAQVSTEGLGCLSDTVGMVVNPITLPVISGTAQVCEDQVGTYSIPDYQNVSIVWSTNPVSSGSVANGQGTNNAEIFWSQPGAHTVNVSVCGSNASFPVTVNANPSPVVQHPAGLCPGNTATIQTTINYVGYTWKDEDGTVLGVTPTLDLGPGVYSVEVTDANGCTGGTEFSIDLWDVPQVSLTTADPTGFCNNSLTVSLTALTNTDGNYSYQWFKDGNTIPGATGSVYFTNQYGNYTVLATNMHGCTATAGPINVFEYCDPTGGGGGVCNIGTGVPCPPGVLQCVPDPTPRCDSFVVTLNDYTGLYVPGTAQWSIGISGGAIIDTSTAEMPSFVFPNAGKFIIAVAVQFSDSTGCTALDSVKVEAKARFDALPSCPGLSSQFENQSELLPDASIIQYAWNFGDPGSGGNNVSGLEDPSHIYNTAGVYQAMLTVTAASGCTSSISGDLEVPDADQPLFTDPVAKCAGNALAFVATPNPDILQLDWDFGDPASGSANEASGNTVYHLFTPGAYTVTATSGNVYGCTATFTRNISVQAPSLSGNISPVNPAPICEGASLTLTAPPGAVSYLWSDGNQTTQVLIVTKEGTYRVTLTDANGCTYTPPPVRVEVRPAPDALIKALVFNELGQVIGTESPQITLCYGEDVALQAFSNGSANYSWSGSLGINQVIYFTDDRNTLLPVGNHLYSVTVTNQATGCTAVSDPFLITVNPVPDGFSISSATFCAGDPNVITYSGSTPGNWQFFWNTGASGTTLATEESGSYYIRVINEFGCEARSNTVIILPGPPVASVPAGCHTRCSPDTLCLPNLPNVVNWQWYLNGAPLPGANSPNFIAQQSGTYWAQLTDVFGCTAESEPLDLTLYTGFGNISGNVWSDVNENGVVDAGDTLVPGITVVVFQNGSIFSAVQSDAGGDFTLANVLSTQYSFNVDPFSLPPNWNIVIGQDQLTLSGCDVSGTVDFLLEYGCQAFGSLQLFACPGGFATYNGTNISVGGAQTFQLTSLTGCDSLLVVSVAPYPISLNHITLQACPGGTASYNGVNLPIGATQDFTFQNWLGCDSLVTVSVTALPTTASNLTLQACPGSTASYNGANLPVGTTQDFIFQNWLGCDSVVTVSVSALPASASSLTLHTCPNGQVMYQGVNLNAGDTQTFTLTNYVGCDSLVTVQVAGDLPASSSSISAGVCPGETYTYQGVTIAAGTTQTFTLTNFVGCDSVVTVSVFQKNASSEVLEVTVCPGETFSYQGQELSIGEAREFHFVNQEQCDSTVTVFVRAHPATTFTAQASASCSNQASGSLMVNPPVGGPGPYRYSLDQVNFQNDPLFETLEAGAYTIYVEDGNNCIAEQTLSITAIPPLQVTLTNGILPCDSSGVILQPLVIGGNGAALNYAWWNGAQTSFGRATEAGPVWVEVSNVCETVRSEAQVQWAELAEDVDIVYVPNVFMPSARDAENTMFRPYFAPGVRLLSFSFAVHDRWGSMLFQTSNTADAWDGYFRSREHNPGVLVWYLDAEVSICGRVMRVVRKGDVTIVR